MSYTVVVPFRNGFASIGRLLDTLPSGQRVIVVDDQSERPYKTKDGRVTVVRPAQRGYFSGAVNAGIGACVDDVLVLNQDVSFSAGFPGALFDKLARSFACFGDGVMGHKAWPKGYVQGTCMYMRRDAIDAVGVLDTVHYPLWGATCEWQLRACRAGFAAKPIGAPKWLTHDRGRANYGSSISAALKAEPKKRQLFIRTPPIVSVVISCFNYGRYLGDAVASLIGGGSYLGDMEPQTFGSFEIVIVDDGSTDRTEKIGRCLADPWKGIRYIRRSETGGTAAANNTGIAAAYGPVVSILCADDMMESWRLGAMYDALRYGTLTAAQERLPLRGTRAASKRSFVYDDCRIVTSGMRRKVWAMGEWDLCQIANKNKIHAGIMMTKQAWRDAGGYAEDMRWGREDWEINVALGKAGYEGIHVHRAGYLYRRDGQNRTERNSTAEWQSRFTAQMRSLHPEVYAMCLGCGSASNRPTGRHKKVSINLQAQILPGEGGGMVLVQYIGRNAGTSTFWGPVTGTPYVFGQARPVGRVDERDLQTKKAKNPGILQQKENGVVCFTQYRPKKQQVIAPKIAAAVGIEQAEPVQVAEAAGQADLVGEGADDADQVPEVAVADVSRETPKITDPESGLKLTVAQVVALEGAGFLTVGDLRDATDEQLVAIKGIGAGTVTKIRASFGAEA